MNYENWLCKQCDHYKGMEDKGAPMLYTRCGNPVWKKYFEKGKDYLLHYASGRPNWCNEEIKDPLEVWQIIRCTTNNGERIGIIQEAAHDPDDSVLATVYGQEAANVKSKEFSAQLGIPEYNNDVDVWLE